MGAVEIVLLIIGGIILILSYALPMQKDKNQDKALKIDEGQIKELVEKEITDAKKHINDIVDETVSYSIEKTERAMERLTNEKIMAVNEYSDSVLEAINKNHNEVVFLYDMLNDKHENLVNTVSKAAIAAKEIQQTVQDAEISVKEKTLKLEEPIKSKAGKESKDDIALIETENTENFVPIAPEKVEVKKKTRRKTNKEEVKVVDSTPAGDTEVQPKEVGEKIGNSNEQILRLHKLGQSNTAIAKELGLGVGEVKLVIDLFEQA